MGPITTKDKKRWITTKDISLKNWICGRKLSLLAIMNYFNMMYPLIRVFSALVSGDHAVVKLGNSDHYTKDIDKRKTMIFYRLLNRDWMVSLQSGISDRGFFHNTCSNTLQPLGRSTHSSRSQEELTKIDHYEGHRERWQTFDLSRRPYDVLVTTIVHLNMYFDHYSWEPHLFFGRKIHIIQLFEDATLQKCERWPSLWRTFQLLNQLCGL